MLNERQFICKHTTKYIYRKAKYRKKYNANEDAKRKAIYLQTHDKIEKHNKQKLTWFMAHSHLSDMVMKNYKTH